MKRFYIAIGSTALNALTSLVYRYREYGLIKDNNGTGEDFFVAIDSDEGQAEKFAQLAPNRDWLLGLKMARDPELHSLVTRAHPGWPEVDYSRGVGGHRTHSLQSLNFTRDPDFERILGKVTPDDSLVILVGSAFGGTSTGSYWSFATWLRTKLNAKKNPFENFFGFVLFPDGKRWAGTFGAQSEYSQMSSNVCNFLRDMEQLRIENAILHEKGTGDLTFCPVSLSQFHPIQADNPETGFGVAGIKQDGERAVDASMGSFLPLESVFMVSTTDAGNGEKAVSDLAAEELFLFGRFDIAGLRKGGTDRVVKQIANLGPRRVTGNPGPEGFCEMHFISARTKRTGVVSEHTKDQLVKRFAEFSNMDTGLLGPATPEWAKIAARMRQHVTAHSLEESGLEADIRQLVDEIMGSAEPKGEAWREAGRAFLNRMRATAKPYPCTSPYAFLEKALELCLEEAKGGNFSAYPDGRLPFTMADVRKLHTELFDPIFALRDPQTGGRAKKELEGLVENFAEELREEAEKRAGLPFWTKIGETPENVRRELKAEGMDVLEKALVAYRHLLGCEASIPSGETFDTLAACYHEGKWVTTPINQSHVRCISKPAVTADDRKGFERDYGAKKDAFYPLGHFFEDALSVLEAYRDSKKPFDLERHVLDYVSETRSVVLGSESLSAKSLGEPLFDGLEGVSGSGKSFEIKRHPVWGGETVRFIVESREGEKKKTEAGGRLRSVRFGEIKAIGDWGQLFRPRDGGDLEAAFDTSRPLEKDENVQRVNPNENLSSGVGGGQVFIDDFWMGDFQFDCAVEGFLGDHYASLPLEYPRQQRMQDEKADDRNYLRLLRFGEGVQFGLVLGCISKKIADLKAANPNSSPDWRARTEEAGTCVIPVACHTGELSAVTMGMFLWVKKFLAGEFARRLFSGQESGAKEFFEELAERENRALSFAGRDAYRLDFSLDNSGLGARSLRTLKALFDSLCAAITVEADTGSAGA